MKYYQKQIVLVCISYFAMYISIFDLQNTQTYLLEQENYPFLGYYSNAICQIFQGLAALCSVYLITKKGAPYCMSVPSLFCLINMAAFYIPFNLQKSLKYRSAIQYMILTTAALNGVGQGLNQTAVGVYLQSKTNENNKGFYFGLFWACYMGSLMAGNLIFSLLI